MMKDNCRWVTLWIVTVNVACFTGILLVGCAEPYQGRLPGTELREERSQDDAIQNLKQRVKKLEGQSFARSTEKPPILAAIERHRKAELCRRELCRTPHADCICANRPPEGYPFTHGKPKIVDDHTIQYYRRMFEEQGHCRQFWADDDGWHCYCEDDQSCLKYMTE